MNEQMLRAADVPHSIYIHLPFCHHRCAYCDFNIYANQPALYEAYVQAVAEEIAATASRAATANQVGRLRVPTIYFGGGTPSLLPAELIGGLLTAVRTFFEVDEEAEITLEANPGRRDARGRMQDADDRAYFSHLHTLGVTRLSLGVQSSHEDELHLLRRGHTFDEAVATYQAARDAGLENINLDLIYGLPDQSIERWRETLQRVIDLRPEHISAYSLQVEEGTALFNWVRDGKVPEPQDEVVAEMYEVTQSMLAETGFEHYEISNWAGGMQDARGKMQVDRRSRHNLVYWRNEAYFGFGCGAHSSHAGQRYWNVLKPRDYIRAVEATGEAVADREGINRALEIGETLMLGLRLIDEGVDRARFADRFGVELNAVFGTVIARLVAQGLIEDLPDCIRLAPRGRLLGNRVFAEFLPESSAEARP
ncbi:MAG: radical SAM family heme chaperone HemW [Chloroflexi bacterium]|nr:radical SAM family heme chaperone HemW [Chloroflexota bacterium]